MIFDLSQDRHLPNYLRHLINTWCAKRMDGRLAIVVWPSFLSDHGDVVALAAQAPDQKVEFITVTAVERQERLALAARPAGRETRFAKLLAQGQDSAYALQYDWHLFGQYAQKLGASHGFIVRIDPFLPLLAAGSALETPLSGIVFGPRFHYGQFDSAPGAEQAHLAEKFILARALRRRALHSLFFLDPFVIEALGAFPEHHKAVYLPDPVASVPAAAAGVQALIKRLDIAPGRRVFLLFGHLTQRKGIEQVLDALAYLPAALGEKACLLIAGTIDPAYATRLAGRIAEIRSSSPAQIVTDFRFVPEAFVPSYFRLADVILCPYQQHAGMSGVILLAAAANRPVLGASYGLMGEMVRRHKLGLAVDSEQPREIGAGMARFIAGDRQSLWDPVQAARLAAQHQPQQFAGAVFERLQQSF